MRMLLPGAGRGEHQTGEVDTHGGDAGARENDETYANVIEEIADIAQISRDADKLSVILG